MIEKEIGTKVHRGEFSKIPKQYMLVLMIVAITILGIDSGWNNQISIIALLGIVYLTIKMDRKTILNSIMFLYVINEISYSFGVPLLPLIWVIYFFKYSLTKKIYSIVLFPFSLFLFYMFITNVFFLDVEIANGITGVVKLFLILHLFIDVFLKEKITKRSVWLGSIYYLALGIIFASLVSMTLEPGRFMVRGFSIVISKDMRNDLAIATGLVTATIMMILHQKNISFNRAKWWALLVPIVLIGISTTSRTYLVMLFISIIWILISTIFKMRKTNKKIIGIICLGMLLSIPFIFKDNSIITQVIRRFDVAENVELLSGRDQIWEIYLNILSSDIKTALFGMRDYQMYGIEMMAHNAWIELWALYGLFGISIIGAMIILLMLKFNRIFLVEGYKISFYSVLPLSLVLLSSFFSHNIIGNIRMFIFLLSYVSLFVFQDNHNKRSIKTRAINENIN